MAKTLDEVRQAIMSLPDPDRQLLAEEIIATLPRSRVLDEAFQRTPEERLRLAQELHDSVLTADERENQQAWIEVAEQRYDDWKGRCLDEAERRHARMESGEDAGLTIEEFLSDDDREPRRH